jgi:hypothetical protein
MLAGNALGQDYDYYFVTYYSIANTLAPDATLRLINDGYHLGDSDVPNVYADIYVFDDSEELQECCSCFISNDGVLSESVDKNLTANPLTGIKPTRGVIKVVADGFGDPTNLFPTSGLHGWMTHIQGTKVTLSPGNPVVPGVAGPFFVTETLLADANLSPTEQTLLQNLCLYDGLLSGKPCTCQPEDFDF